MVDNFELFWPLDSVIVTQGWGENKTPLYKQLGMLGHNGLDLFAVDGTLVRAAHDGKVVYSGLDGANGNLIVIITNEPFAYGANSAYFKTLYGHLQGFAVKAGEQVKVGDVIGYADNTGASTGSHLHFGCKPVQKGEEEWVWFNIEQSNFYNGAIDPTPYLNGVLAKNAQPMFSILYKLIDLLKQAIAKKQYENTHKQ